MNSTMELVGLALIVVVAAAVILGDHYRDTKHANSDERRRIQHMDEMLRDRAGR